MSFSFSHIPIGLGLATAAHIHLCRKNLAHAERLRQRHQDQNLTMQTLSDMVVLTEVIELLDGTIDSISTMHPKQRSKRTQNSKAYQCKESPSKLKINGSNEVAVRQSAPSLPIPLELSADNIDLWTRAYRELRLTQEQGVGKAVQRPILQASGQTCVALKINFALSSILSASTLLYHVASTGKLAQLVFPTAILARLIGTWSTQKQPPIATGPMLSSSIMTTGMLILPLAPALFISGIHFLAALKARHTLTQLANHHHTHKKHAKRSSFLGTFLLVRERRLNWLVHQIRSFEQTQEPGTKQNETCSPQPLLDLGPSTTTHQEKRIPTDPWLAVGPHLSHLDMDTFLRDPAERARVLCMELRATREELAVFMASMPTTKITHAL
ncbi:MAG: hypothetical protein BYD32DRAFT_484652 [Podila humilis]|nr:MAG: hypothetical protein BYD32DRAFT_484652 [Podila humilis]